MKGYRAPGLVGQLFLKVCVVFALAGAVVSCLTDEKKTDISKIISLDSIGYKTKIEVEAVIGKPDSTSNTFSKSIGCIYGCERAWYKNKQVEIVYINGKADWITVTPIKKPEMSELTHPFDLIGGSTNDARRPTFQNDAVLRYNYRTPGKAPEIAVFIKNGRLSYYQIKLATN